MTCGGWMVCEGIEEHYQKRVLKELGGWGLKDKVNAAMVIRMRLICDYDRRWRKCWKQVPIRKAKGGLNSNSRRMAVTNWILALPSPSLSYLPPSFPFSLSPSTLSPGSCLLSSKAAAHPEGWGEYKYLHGECQPRCWISVCGVCVFVLPCLNSRIGHDFRSKKNAS